MQPNTNLNLIIYYFLSFTCIESVCWSSDCIKMTFPLSTAVHRPTGGATRITATTAVLIGPGAGKERRSTCGYKLLNTSLC